MARDEAESLATQIRQRVQSVADGFTEIEAMIKQAKDGKAHQALGYKSWTAFVADVLSGLMKVDRQKRRAFVPLMRREGMSQRAIAKALDVSQSTIRDDLSSTYSHAGPDRVTSLDGKSRPATGCSRNEWSIDGPLPERVPIARWDPATRSWVMGTDALGQPVPFTPPSPPEGTVRGGVLYGTERNWREGLKAARHSVEREVQQHDVGTAESIDAVHAALFKADSVVTEALAHADTAGRALIRDRLRGYLDMCEETQ
jgi:hypothetical protein